MYKFHPRMRTVVTMHGQNKNVLSDCGPQNHRVNSSNMHLAPIHLLFSIILSRTVHLMFKMLIAVNECEYLIN